MHQFELVFYMCSIYCFPYCSIDHSTIRSDTRPLEVIVQKSKYPNKINSDDIRLAISDQNQFPNLETDIFQLETGYSHNILVCKNDSINVLNEVAWN